MAVPVAALAGGEVELREIDYETWSKPNFGDPLPDGGPVIRVFSEDGVRFDSVGHANEPVKFLGLLSGSCPSADEISSLEFEVSDQRASVSHPGGRGAWFSRTGVVELSRAEPRGFHAVRECNNRLKALATRSGRSRRELVTMGFGIRFRNWIEGRAILKCTGRGNSDSDTARLDLWVHCGGTPEVTDPDAPTTNPVPAGLSPLITDLTFEVDHPAYVGECPVELQFTGSITTSRAGKIGYRSVSHDGTSSQVFALTFASAGTKAIASWSETLAKPEPSGALTAGPENKGHDYEGWRRLEIVAPPGFAPSPSADYSVTCQE